MEGVLQNMDRVISVKAARVEGLAMIKKHLKKSEKNPQGAISELEGSIHISNLMAQSAFDSSKRKKSAPAA